MTIFVPLIAGGFYKTLADYQLDTQRLLHDSSNYYPLTDLTAYINEGRWRVVEDTGCYRVLQTISLVANKETYSFATDFPQGQATINVLNATLIWGNVRQPLKYRPWTQLNAEARAILGWTDRPIWWSQFGQNTFYLEPVSAQIYSVEMDTIVLPPYLTNTTDVDVLQFPYVRAVPYYAAYLAKLNDQLPKDAEEFHQRYLRAIKEIQYATVTRRLGS